MTDNDIKTLAEKYANTVDWKLGSEFYSSHEMWTKAKESFEAGYRAATDGADGKLMDGVGQGKKTIIISAFPGTGKTHICENTKANCVEVEYWKYKDRGLQNEYVADVKKHIGDKDCIFLSTDPDGLRVLHEIGLDITLVYPKNELREEYLNRYTKRDSPHEFIGAFMKYWNVWIDELKQQTYCNQIVLGEGQYLSDVIKFSSNSVDKREAIYGVRDNATSEGAR